MKPTAPHHLLSAYLDGELSPVEVEDVERLLAESPQARQELSELEHVRELIRQIPRESLPEAFSSQVLDVCLADTGQFESETLSGQSALKVARRTDSPRKASWWMPAVGVAAVAVVGLIVMFNFPDPQSNGDRELARHAGTDDRVQDDRQAIDHASDERTLPMAGDGQGDASINEAGLAQADRAEADNREDNAKIMLERALTDAPQNPDDEREAQLSDEVAKASKENAVHVAVVNVFVQDTTSGLAELRSLLDRHQIRAATPEKSQLKQVGTDRLAVYVESDEDQLAAALGELQRASKVRGLRVEAPISLAQLEPMLRSPQAGFGRAQSQRAMPFGTGGAATSGARRLGSPGIQAMKAAEAQPAPAGSEEQQAKEKPTTESAAKKDAENKRESAARPEPNAEKRPGESASKRRISAAASTPLDKLRDQPAQAVKPEETDAKQGPSGRGGFENQNAPKPANAFRAELALPQKTLNELQKRTSGDDAKDPEAAEPTSMPPAETRRRVQVLFVLIEQTAAPADQPAPPAEAGK